MLNLIKGELFKTRKSGITYVVIGIMFFLIFFSGALYLYDALSESAFNFEGVNGFSSYMVSFDMDLVFIIIALFAGSMITNEYVYGSIRQIVSRGLSRKKIILGQYLSIGISLSVIFVVTALLNGVVATCFFGTGNIDWLRAVIATAGFCSMAFGYGGFSMFLAYLIKSGGLCLGINICFIIGGSLGVKVIYVLTKSELVTKLWIDNLRSQIVDYTAPIGSQIQAVATFFIMGIIFLLATMVLFQKRDVD